MGKTKQNNNRIIFFIGYGFAVFSYLSLYLFPMIYLSLDPRMHFSIFDIAFSYESSFLGIDYQLFAFSPWIIILTSVLLADLIGITFMILQNKINKYLFVLSVLVLIVISTMLLNIPYLVVEGNEFQAFEFISGLGTQSVSIIAAYGAIIAGVSALIGAIILFVGFIKQNNK